jgi:hypothetical protein
VNERRDDTTKTEAESRAPGRYYYDDATGYEVYKPDEEVDDEDGGAKEEDEGRRG